MAETEQVSASLFSWKDAQGNDQTLDVDIVMSAEDTRSAKLTDHVVEDGSVITDHIVIQPEKLQLVLLVSQTPVKEEEGFQTRAFNLEVRKSLFVPGGFLLLTQGVRAGVSAAAGAVSGAAGLATQSRKHSAITSSAGDVDRVASVHDQLIRILQDALPVTVSFKGRLYPDYVLEEVQLSHAPGKFGSATFSVSARAFRTVTGNLVTLPDPADFRAKASSQQGKKNAKEKPGTPDEGKMESIFVKITDGAAPYVNALTGGGG